QSPGQAKFSLEFGLAMIALRGRCAIADFDPATVSSHEVRSFYPRVRRFPVAKSEGEFPTEVEGELIDGSRHPTPVRLPVGSLAAPLSDRQQAAKSDARVEGLISSPHTRHLRDTLIPLARRAS